MTGANWSLLYDTRERATASPVPEPCDADVGGQDLDWDVGTLPHHQQPASDLCLQVMQREPLGPASPDPSPVRLVLPVARVVLQRLVVALPASQVLGLGDQSL